MILYYLTAFYERNQVVFLSKIVSPSQSCMNGWMPVSVKAMNRDAEYTFYYGLQKILWYGNMIKIEH